MDIYQVLKEDGQTIQADKETKSLENNNGMASRDRDHAMNTHSVNEEIISHIP